MSISNHYKSDRKERDRVIREEIGGYGKPIARFENIDKGHANGPEIHVVTDTGIIIVFNQKTKVMCTTKIARPAQIYNLYDRENRTPPKKVIELAREHQAKGYHLL